MKRISIVAFILFHINAFAQQPDALIEFPESFQLDISLFPDFELLPINEEVRRIGIKENPGVIETMIAMRYLTKSDTTIEGLNRIYIEFYQHRERKSADAGVMVFDFETKTEMNRYLSTKNKQSNFAVLTLHHYLIEVWSDDSRNREKQLRAMVNYYQNKLGAVEYLELTEDTANVVNTVMEEDVTVEAAEQTAYDATKDASDDAGGLIAVDANETAEDYYEVTKSEQPRWEFTDSIGQAQDSMLLDKAFWEEHGLERLEKFQTDFTYTLYKKLEAPDYTLWMIARDYSEEQIHWGVLFDSDGNYLGFKQIAYDNSEGFFIQYTAFKGDEIRIYTKNSYENEGAPSFQRYMMTRFGFAN